MDKYDMFSRKDAIEFINRANPNKTNFKTVADVIKEVDKIDTMLLHFRTSKEPPLCKELMEHYSTLSDALEHYKDILLNIRVSY